MYLIFLIFFFRNQVQINRGFRLLSQLWDFKVDQEYGGEHQKNYPTSFWFWVIMGTKKCPLDCGMLLIPAPSLDLKKRAFVIIIRSLTPSPGSFSRGNSSLSTEYCAFTCEITSICSPWSITIIFKWIYWILILWTLAVTPTSLFFFESSLNRVVGYRLHFTSFWTLKFQNILMSHF